jgi:hypothetical protein
VFSTTSSLSSPLNKEHAYKFHKLRKMDYNHNISQGKENMRNITPMMVG